MSRSATVFHFSLDRDELAAVLAALRAVTDRLALLVDEKPAARRWLSTSEAAEIAHVGSAQTARNWARRYGIGILVKDRWQIDPLLLEQLLSDRTK